MSRFEIDKAEEETLIYHKEIRLPLHTLSQKLIRKHYSQGFYFNVKIFLEIPFVYFSANNGGILIWSKWCESI